MPNLVSKDEDLASSLHSRNAHMAFPIGTEFSHGNELPPSFPFLIIQHLDRLIIAASEHVDKLLGKGTGRGLVPGAVDGGEEHPRFGRRRQILHRFD